MRRRPHQPPAGSRARIHRTSVSRRAFSGTHRSSLPSEYSDLPHPRATTEQRNVGGDDDRQPECSRRRWIEHTKFQPGKLLAI
jgi:hypothetical protein